VLDDAIYVAIDLHHLLLLGFALSFLFAWLQIFAWLQTVGW